MPHNNNDGSSIRLRPQHRDHVLSYDFVMDCTAEGRAFRRLTIVDAYSRECLAIDVARNLTSEDVLKRLSDLFVRPAVPEHISSDNGSEFTAKRAREWLGLVGVKTLHIEPGSPWENGYVESFSGKLPDELLEREVFDTLFEAKMLIERRRRHYNTVRPHSALGYRAPGSWGLVDLCGRFGYASSVKHFLECPDLRCQLLQVAHPELFQIPKPPPDRRQVARVRACHE